MIKATYILSKIAQLPFPIPNYEFTNINYKNHIVYIKRIYIITFKTTTSKNGLFA